MGTLISKLLGRSREAERVNGNGVSHVRVMHSRRQGVSRAGYAGSRLWRSSRSSAESAPCTCPDFCERDHAND